MSPTDDLMHISIEMKATRLIEVWIEEKYVYLSSHDFLDFMKDLLMG
jgi:hypothetical protein